MNELLQTINYDENTTNPVEQLWNQAKDMMEYIGDGAHRDVFQINDEWVMKVARYEIEQNYPEVDLYDELGDDYLAKVLFNQELLNNGVLFMEYVEPIEEFVNENLPDDENYYGISRIIDYHALTYLDYSDLVLFDEFLTKEYNLEQGSFIEFMDYINGWQIKDIHIGNVGVRGNGFVALDYNYGRWEEDEN